MQRILEILLSIVALFVLAPLLVPVMIILRFSGEREIFFVQERVGRGGKPFGLLKFATMLKDSPNIGAGEITLKNDPRVLPFGRLLRRTKINELPQLINILKGDLSFVGPRPMVPKTYALYPEDAQRELNTICPGLTGIGSIIFRDEERYLDSSKDPVGFYRDVIIPYKASLELWYVRNRSLGLYLLLIFLTAWAVSYTHLDVYKRQR